MGFNLAFKGLMRGRKMTFHTEGLHSVSKYMAMWNSETNKYNKKNCLIK
jgi:hypothetical protein